MLARLQAVIAIALLAASIAWASGFARAGHPLWGIAGATLLVFGYALFLAAEFVLLFRLGGDESAPRPTPQQLVRAWWHEAISAPRVFLWRQPFRSRRVADHVPAMRSAKTGVVLVHGFVCNRGLWNDWMQILRARDTPFAAVNLEPVFGSIDDYAAIIEAAVARIEAVTPGPVVLVGHSMGGVAIRGWLDRFGADARVHRVLTIGSPHGGTWLARFGHTVNGRQMRLRSEWLTDLAVREPAHRYAKFSCYFSHCDNIVFPAASATLPGAENIHVPGTAHVHLAFSPVVFAGLLRWLD